MLIGVNVVVALSLVLGAAGVGYAEWRLGQIKRVRVHGVTPTGQTAQSPTPKSGSPAMTILVVGSDTRVGLNQPGDSQYGSGAQVAGARSDTIILARVVPATHQVALLSIPRDLWVPVPGYGYQKINFAVGVSPDLLISVLHQQLGIDVNHYVDVDFDSFKDISNAVGGVEQYFPTQVSDYNAGLNIPAPGCYNLSGNLALAFVRSREYTYYQNGRWIGEDSSDLARIQRQQIFIRKLVKKAEGSGFGDPLKLNRIIGGVTKNLTVDSTLSTGALINLAQQFRSLNADTIPGWTLPTYAEVLPGPNDVLIAQAVPARAMVQQFLAFGSAPAPPAASGPSVQNRAHSTTATTAPPPSTVPAGSVAVEVENGSGIAGQATAAASGLRSAGFSVLSVSSAPTLGHLTSEIRYGAGGLAAAQTVETQVGGGADLQQDPSLGASTVVLVTGSSYTSAAAGTAIASGRSTGSSSTSVPHATSTSVPPTTSTTYVLPGTPSGSPPPSC